MARSADPLIDLERCAQLLDQAAVLMSRGVPVMDVVTGIAERIRDNLRKIAEES